MQLNELKTQQKFADMMFQLLELAISFQTVTLPQTNVGAAYYSLKLNFYNLTLCEFGTNRGSCYCWTEDQLTKAPSDIAIGVCRWLEEVDQRVPAAKEVNLFSDPTVSQTRNRVMSAAFIHFLSRSANITSIIHNP